MTLENELRCAGEMGGIHDAQQRGALGEHVTAALLGRVAP
jgi:hypothetical protein